jgi:hypothetical protein
MSEITIIFFIPIHLETGSSENEPRNEASWKNSLPSAHQLRATKTNFNLLCREIREGSLSAGDDAKRVEIALRSKSRGIQLLPTGGSDPDPAK